MKKSGRKALAEFPFDSCIGSTGRGTVYNALDQRPLSYTSLNLKEGSDHLGEAIPLQCFAEQVVQRQQRAVKMFPIEILNRLQAKFGQMGKFLWFLFLAFHFKRFSLTALDVFFAMV